MQDIVILPTFDRPEMLWLCLEHIFMCSESANLDIRVFVDIHTTGPQPLVKEIVAVLEHFPQLPLTLTVRTPHSYPGNSYNLMTAYKEISTQACQHVFMIEDDVMVRPNFFFWHKRVQSRNPVPACTVGVRNPGHGAYASLGVCFRPDVLTDIAFHCKPEYFDDMKGYCARTFPASKFDVEQDGLIARVLKGKRVVWAKDPVATHVGWYGYHRRKSKRPSGSLTERYEKVKQVLQDPLLLQEYDKDFHDIEPLII